MRQSVLVFAYGCQPTSLLLLWAFNDPGWSDQAAPRLKNASLFLQQSRFFHAVALVFQALAVSLSSSFAGDQLLTTACFVTVENFASVVRLLLGRRSCSAVTFSSKKEACLKFYNWKCLDRILCYNVGINVVLKLIYLKRCICWTLRSSYFKFKL